MGGRLLRKLAETNSKGDEGVAWIQEGDLHRSMEKGTVSEERERMRKRMMEREINMS